MKYSILSILLAAGLNGFAQSDSLAITAQTDSTVATKKNTLTLASIYANDASYYGQRPETASPYAAVAATYQLKSGIYFTGLTYKILTEDNPNISAANIGAGINFKLSKKLSADIRYTHSFYPELSPLLQSINTENVSLGFKHSGWLETVVSSDYAFGQTNDVFATGGFAKDINLFSISDKDLVSLKPYAYAVAGTQRYFETYVQEQKIRDSVLGITTIPILGGGTTTSSDTTTRVNNSFDVLSYNLEIPLTYSRANYAIEASVQLAWLSKRAQSQPGKLNTFFTVGFYYQF